MSAVTRDNTTPYCRKFVEGWGSIQDPVTKDWLQRWMVLRGSTLCLFNSDHTIPENLVGSLLIDSTIALHNLPSKKGFKFLLVATSNYGHLEKIFRFDRAKDFNLWKAFILGISQRKLPDNVSLQLEELHALKMAIREIAMINDQVMKRSSIIDQSSDYSHMSAKSVTKKSPDIHVQQSESSDLSVQLPNSGPFSSREERTIAALENRSIRLARSALMAAISDLTLEVGTDSHARTIRCASDSSDSDGLSMNSTLSSSENSSSSAAVYLKQLQPECSDYQPVGCHLFYTDPEKNKETPTWFLNCSREEAVNALTAGHRYGNVLMRAHHKPGQYVISLCRRNAGKVDISHFRVITVADGFKIDVRNDHQPLKCLSDVMEYFVTVAGTATRPLTTNDLRDLIAVTNLHHTSLNTTCNPDYVEISQVTAAESKLPCETSVYESITPFPTDSGATLVGTDEYVNAADICSSSVFPMQLPSPRCHISDAGPSQTVFVDKKMTTGQSPNVDRQLSQPDSLSPILQPLQCNTSIITVESHKPLYSNRVVSAAFPRRRLTVSGCVPEVIQQTAIVKRRQSDEESETSLKAPLQTTPATSPPSLRRMNRPLPPLPR